MLCCEPDANFCRSSSSVRKWYKYNDKKFNGDGFYQSLKWHPKRRCVANNEHIKCLIKLTCISMVAKSQFMVLHDLLDRTGHRADICHTQTWFSSGIEQYCQLAWSCTSPERSDADMTRANPQLLWGSCVTTIDTLVFSAALVLAKLRIWNQLRDIVLDEIKQWVHISAPIHSVSECYTLWTTSTLFTTSVQHPIVVLAFFRTIIIIILWNPRLCIAGRNGNGKGYT